jgi:lipopolysaccharide export LptBFGC system permease protein LptF
LILQRYILRELMLTFALSFAAIVSVCAVGIIFQTFRSYEGMTFGFLLRLAPAALTQMTPWAMIVSACLTATLVYGRLAADNEIDAVRTSGIRVSRLLTPAILFGLVLSAAAFFVHGEAAPRARFARRSLIKEAVLFVLSSPPAGRQNELKIGSRNRLSYLDMRDGTLVRPALLILDRGRPFAVWFAREGRIVVPEEGAPTITLADGAFVHFASDPKAPPSKPPLAKADGHFESYKTVPFELEDIFKRRRGPADMPTAELNQYRLGLNPGDELQEAETEYHGRYARALAPLVLVLLCAPIGVFVKKGSRLAGMGAALPPMLFYILLMITGEGAASKGQIDPRLATYGGVGLIAVTAVFLLWRVVRR